MMSVSDVSASSSSSSSPQVHRSSSSSTRRLSGTGVGPSAIWPFTLCGCGRASGRLDLLGGVADYSGSLVLETPVSTSTVVSIRPLLTANIRLSSSEFGKYSFSFVSIIELVKRHLPANLKPHQKMVNNNNNTANNQDGSAASAGAGGPASSSSSSLSGANTITNSESKSAGSSSSSCSSSVVKKPISYPMSASESEFYKALRALFDKHATPKWARYIIGSLCVFIYHKQWLPVHASESSSSSSSPPPASLPAAVTNPGTSVAPSSATKDAEQELIWGLSFEIESDVPTSMGVSSSSAIEIATLRAVANLANLLALGPNQQSILSSCSSFSSACMPASLNSSFFGSSSSTSTSSAATPLSLSAPMSYWFVGTELARFGQLAENNLVPAPCGLMDQLTVSYGRHGSILPIECRPDVLKPLIALPNDVMVVGWSSGVKHSVGDSPYMIARVASFMGKKILESTYQRNVKYTSQFAPSFLALKQHDKASNTDKTAAASATGSASSSTSGMSIIIDGVTTSSGTSSDAATVIDQNSSFSTSSTSTPPKSSSDAARRGSGSSSSSSSSSSCSSSSSARFDCLPVSMLGSEFISAYAYVDDPLSSILPNVSYPVRAATMFPVLENQRAQLARHLLASIQHEDAAPTESTTSSPRTSSLTAASASASAPQATAESSSSSSSCCSSSSVCFAPVNDHVFDVLQSVGELMYESHVGYSRMGLGHQVTDSMIDALINGIGAAGGVYGARISGGGSGGTVVILCHRRALEAIDKLQKSFPQHAQTPIII